MDARKIRQNNLKINRNIASAKPVTVKKHLCKLPLYSGTKDSCDFHYNLYLCNDVEIFATETVKTFIKFKAA